MISLLLSVLIPLSASTGSLGQAQAQESTSVPTPSPEATETAVIATATAVSTSTVVITPTATIPPPPSVPLTPTATAVLTLTVTATPTVVVTPTATATLTPTVALTPTATPTLTPTQVVTHAPTPTMTPTPALTVTQVATATSTPTPTATPVITITPTLTPTATPVLTVTPVLTPTATPTITPTVIPTITITPTPEVINLGLTMQVDPAFVNPGEQVTVTLTLSNPAQVRLESLIISNTLPVALNYETPLGAVAPGYNPLLNLLRWRLPPDLSSQARLTLGYVGRAAVTAPPSALSLVADLEGPGLPNPVWAQAALIITQPPPTPTPEPTPEPVGPPARLQLGIKERRDPALDPAEHGRWAAVYVVDADGLAVADGTAVTLTLQGGELAQSVLQTKDGVATVRFKTPRGQPFTLTATAGAIQESRQGPVSGPEAMPHIDHKRQDSRYGEATEAVIRARNAVRQEGAGWTAQNQTRRVEFSPDQTTFNLKLQNNTLRDETAQLPPDEHFTLGFQLTDVRVGRQSLHGGRLEMTASHNWVTYQASDDGWQMVYRVGDAALEQYFIFEKGTPIDGDLVIEGDFQTRLRPIFLSEAEGIRFVPPSRGQLRADQPSLGYGPALVEDALGRRLTAQMTLRGRNLQVRIPEGWLAQAEFPIVVDPVLGPAEVVAELQGEAGDPAVASDGTDMLTVWSWNGDIYAQRVDATGQLSGTLITLSQADGVQDSPQVIYNSVADEYLALWQDHRYGLSYSSVRARRIDPSSGQLLGTEIELLPQTKAADYTDVAVSTAGDYVAVWADQAQGEYDLKGQMLSSSGVLSGTAVTISNGSGSQIYASVGYDSQEDVFLVAWGDDRSGAFNVYSRRVTAGGTPLGSDQLLDSSSNADRWPDVAGNGSGQFLVVWQREVSGSDVDIRAIRVAADTDLIQGTDFTLDAGDTIAQTPAVTAIGSGSYLVVWDDAGAIQTRTVASDGTTGSVSTLSESTGGVRAKPDVAQAGSQSLAVWTDSSQTVQTIITGRRVTGSGTSSGDEIYISPYFGLLERLDLTYHSQADEFLLIWQQTGQAPDADVYVQRVDEQGQLLGAALNLTNHPAGQEKPVVAAGNNGYLAV